MITAQQVTALLAQAAKAAYVNPTDQDGNLLPNWQLNIDGDPVYVGSEIASRGIGVYGQTPANLVLTGYLKPGTLNLITEPSLTITVLNTPAVWTGKQGIESLIDYLDNPILQNIAQTDIMNGAFQGLINAGVITGDETARYQATFLQPATRYGVDAVVNWVSNTVAEDLLNNLLISARQGQYAIDFVDTYSADLNIAEDSLAVTNTVERQEIDEAVTEIIGNSKVPAIIYADEAAVTIPVADNEDGQFRFAPGKPKA